MDAMLRGRPREAGWLDSGGGHECGAAGTLQITSGRGSLNRKSQGGVSKYGPTEMG